MSACITEAARLAERTVATDGRVHLGMPRVPDADTWDPCKVSQQHVAGYKPFSVVDGEGVRCSLFVSGCLFKCPGCFNEAAWSFRYGEPYTVDLEDRIMVDLAQPYVQGLTLLGGEPFQNTQVCLSLAQRVRTELPGKDIWAWSGHTFEWVRANGVPSQKALLETLDVLVDGPFRHDIKRYDLPFRGSANQRILDVKASLAAGVAVPWGSR